VSEVEAAFAAGYAAERREQAAAADPMGGATPLDGGNPAQQPYIPPEPGDSIDAGVT
jgi:hypothetical protein